MDWIEIIQLKAFSGKERDNATGAFHQLTPPVKAVGLKEINLFQSFNLENELIIIMAWQGNPPESGKSRLGLQLASAFTEFGHIYHAGWKHRINLVRETWSVINEHQIAV